MDARKQFKPVVAEKLFQPVCSGTDLQESMISQITNRKLKEEVGYLQMYNIFHIWNSQLPSWKALLGIVAVKI